jgi:outer membrane murein-binding lipoprotein Lpp
MIIGAALTICRRAAFAIGPGRWQAICFRTWRAKQLEAKQRREREEVLAMLEKAIPDVHTLTSTIERLEADVRRLQKQMESTASTAARDREQRIQQTIRQWRHQSLATAFDGWRGLLEARREAMRKAVGQWAHGVLAFTFQIWHELLVTTRADETTKLARAVGRWARRELSGGFGHWSSLARAARTSKVQLRRAVGRWAQRLLATVVGSWAEYVSRSRRAKARGDEALRRMSHGLLGATYWAWAEHVAETVTRRQELLRRTGARLANRTLVLTIEAWRALAADSVSRREGLWHKAAAMLRGRVAGLALYAWIEYVQRSKQVLRKAAYAIGPGYSLSLGFRTWHAAVREGLRAHERARTLELLGEALPELVRGVLAEITGGGAAMLGDRAEVEELAREVRELRKSISSNAERATRDREHKINQTIRTWKHHHLARAFDGWSGLLAFNSFCETCM